MDIVKILRDSINRLPLGEHSTGLSAVMRHVESAIRHFERTDEGDLDSFTDAIYRTNQAFEGSLKEAYRVLTGKNPSDLTINEIEKYLEDKGVVRKRVITQLTRYRHDYRNPSTHDYKLDFDQNESLLAILSVCAFSKLLVDQIAQRLAFDAAREAGGSESPPPPPSQKNALRAAAEFSLQFTKTTQLDLSFSEFEGSLAGALSAANIPATTGVAVSSDVDVDWDIFVSSGSTGFPIEVRNVPINQSSSSSYGISFVKEYLNDNISGAIIVMRSHAKTDYRLVSTSYANKNIYFVTKYSTRQIHDIAPYLTDIKEVKPDII